MCHIIFEVCCQSYLKKYRPYCRSPVWPVKCLDSFLLNTLRNTDLIVGHQSGLLPWQRLEVECSHWSEQRPSSYHEMEAQLSQILKFQEKQILPIHSDPRNNF